MGLIKASGTAGTGMDRMNRMQNNTASWWFKDPGQRRLALAIAAGWSSSMAVGFDSSLISGLLSMPLFLPALGVSNSNELGLILGSTLLGGIPGIFIAAWTADKFGRRFNLAFGGVIIIGGAIMQALVTGGWKLMGGKIVLGFGSSFQSVAAGPYVAEVAHPRNRPQVTALINTFYYVGSVIAAWTTYGTLQGLSGDWTWRLPLLLQAAPSVITLALVLVVSESPRWLLSKGRTNEAHVVLAKYHANGKMDDEMVLHELAEIKEALELEKLASAVSYKTFTSTRGNKHRLAILILTGVLSQWVGNGIITNYLPFILQSVGIASPKEQTLYNGGLQIFNWVAATAAALACERVGRRPLWLFSAIGMLLSFTIITACSATYDNTGSVAAGKVVIAFLFIYFGFYDAAFTSMTYVYVLEVLPFALRTKGMAIFSMCCYVSAFFNIFVNPIALEKLAWKYYFVYIGVNLFAIVAIWFLYPETKGRLLEEVALIFDGPRGELDAATPENVNGIDIDDDLKLHNKTEADHREFS